jgi:hypothetical protein
MINIKLSFNGKFNVDGAGITAVQHKTSKVIDVRAKRQIAESPPSAETVAQTTVVTSGQTVPTLMTLPRIT